VYQRLKAEFLSVLPAVVFFFLAFNLINITHALFFHKQRIALYRELDLLIGAQSQVRCYILWICFHF